MVIAELLVGTITSFIDATGYASVFILMIMESMVFPVPSEAVMPFAGFLIAQQKFSWAKVIFWSTLGSIVGSLISYYIGRYGGKPFIRRYGKYFLLSQRELDATERFFRKYGCATIFFSRFIPVVRHLISIPAGMAKMPLLPFCVFTIIGAGLWNAFLAYVGFVLQNNWQSIMRYAQIIDIAVIVLLVVAVVYFVFTHRRR